MFFSSRIKLNQSKSLIAATCVGAALLLGSCGSTPTQQNASDFELSSNNIDSYLEEASTLPITERIIRQLNAAEFLFKQGQIDRCHTLLDSIEQSKTNENQYLRLTLLKSAVALKDGEPYLAQRYLFDAKLDQNVDTQYSELRIKLLDQRATLMFDQDNYIRAFEQRIALGLLLKTDDERAQLNHDLLWEYLAELDESELTRLSQEETNQVKAGWYSLAALSKRNAANYRQQIQEIQQWQMNWPTHPANQLLPADLIVILQLADQQVQQIAVLLPLSGKLESLGKAIQEGLLAAYYNDLQTSPLTPELRFFDSNTDDITALYDKAVAEGAELIIGPLSKKQILSLSNYPERKVTTLALNTASKEPLKTNVNEQRENSLGERPTEFNPAQSETTVTSDPASTEQEAASTARLYQFSLAIEDEAEQIAKRVWRDGHRQGLIITPNNSWGKRGADTFSSQWQALDGNILGQETYKEQRAYSKLIESAVAVDQSKARHQQMQRLLKQKLEFEPRKRKDIDFIFLLARPTQARQLLPLLSYHYAGDIPVYASSQVYEGKSSKKLSDLNGLRFSSMPWLLDNTIKEQQDIAQNGANLAALQQLYALGVDAYHIYPRLEQLKNIPQAQFYGSTGKLSINSDLRIIRQQNFGEIKNGRAIELKTETNAHQ